MKGRGIVSVLCPPDEGHGGRDGKESPEKKMHVSI